MRGDGGDGGSVVREDVLMDRVANAAAHAKDWTRRRDEAIAEAVKAGISQREVARTTGLSHTSVQNIVRRADNGEARR